MSRRTFIGKATLGHEKPEYANDEDLIKGFLPRKGICFFVGEPGSGKSLMVLHLAACLGANKQLVEIEPEGATENDSGEGYAVKKGAILYLMGEGEARFYLRAKAAYDAISDNLDAFELESLGGQLPIIILPVKALTGLDDLVVISERIKEQVRILENGGYKILAVVFDTFARACKMLDESNSTEMSEVIDWIKEFGTQLDSLVIIVTHPPKVRGAKRGDLRGSGTLKGDADIIWFFRKIKKGLIELYIAKGKDGFHEDDTYHFHAAEYGKSVALMPIKRESKSATTNKRNTKILNNSDALAEKPMRLYLVIKNLIIKGEPATEEKILSELSKMENEEKAIAGEKPIKEASLAKQVRRSLEKLKELRKITSHANGIYSVPITMDMLPISREEDYDNVPSYEEDYNAYMRRTVNVNPAFTSMIILPPPNS